MSGPLPIKTARLATISLKEVLILSENEKREFENLAYNGLRAHTLTKEGYTRVLYLTRLVKPISGEIKKQLAPEKFQGYISALIKKNVCRLPKFANSDALAEYLAILNSTAERLLHLYLSGANIPKEKISEYASKKTKIKAVSLICMADLVNTESFGMNFWELMYGDNRDRLYYDFDEILAALAKHSEHNKKAFGPITPDKKKLITEFVFELLRNYEKIVEEPLLLDCISARKESTIDYIEAQLEKRGVDLSKFKG